MRLYEFVPICDHDIDDDSLIERAFGPEFCVVDETRQLLTSVHNQNLLLRAKALLDKFGAVDRERAEVGLRTLRALAKVVTQRDYERAVRWEIRDSIAYHDRNRLFETAR